MTFNQIIKRYGSQVAAADALCFHRNAVSRWKKNGIKMGTQLLIERATNYELVARKQDERVKSCQKKGSFSQ